MHLALRGKLFLGEAKLVAPLLDLFANDVGWMSCSGHARKCELDNRRETGLICYAFLAKQKKRNVETQNIEGDNMFLKRLGPDPHANGALTPALKGCPDIFELETGDFAIIGIDITSTAAPKLPPSASCGPDERIIRIPRHLLVNAKSDIPNRV
jgi:hypothetical protein